MTRKRTLATVTLLLSAALALSALAGCSQATVAPAASAPAGAEAASAPATPPTLVVDEPAEGAELPAGDVRVSVTTTNLKFAMPSNNLVPGEGHVHFTLDDKPFQMSTKPEYVFTGVTPGPHKLKAELVQNNTQPFDPPVEQEITFTVK